MAVFNSRKSSKYEQDVVDFKNNNPELYEKLQGNLTGRQRAFVEQNNDINLKFGEIYNGHSTKLTKQFYSDISREELNKVFEVANVYYKNRESDIRMEIRDDDFTRGEYQRFIDKGATDIPYDEVLCISKARESKKDITGKLIFTTFESNLAFDERQDISTMNINSWDREKVGDGISYHLECTNSLIPDGVIDVIYNRLNAIGFDKSAEEVLKSGIERDLSTLRETLLESSGEIFDELKPVDKSSISYQIYERFSENSGKMAKLEEQGYEMYTLSKGKKGLTDVYKDICIQSSMELRMAISPVYSQMCNMLCDVPEIDDFSKKTLREYSAMFEESAKDHSKYPFIKKLHEICEEYGITFSNNDYRQEVEHYLGEKIPEGYSMDFDNRNFILSGDNVHTIRMEVIEFKEDFYSMRKDIEKFKEDNDLKTIKPRENILMIHPDDKGKALELLGKVIERKFKDPRPVDFSDYAKIDVQLEKYRDVIEVQKNLEHTVKQGLEYASIFNEKKNINQRTLEKMENTPFKEHFKKVEFDNDVEFESFNTKGSGKAVMDSLEKAVSDIKPILEKAKCNEVELKFRKLGNLQKKSNKGIVSGVYIPAHDCIAIDINKDTAYRSLIHEIGHRIDFAMTDTILSNARKFQTEVGDVYKQAYNKIANDGHHDMMKNEKIKRYLLSGTEMFARSYEFALNEKGIASDFTKDDEAIRTEKNGYIFHLMDDKSKEKILNYMEEVVGIEKDVEAVLENRSKRLGIDISELRPEKESEVTYNNETKEPKKEEQEISEYEEKLDDKDTKLKEVGLPFAEREY